MRVILVGSAAERARLRAQLNGSLTVVAEVPTMAAARTSYVAAAVIVIAYTGVSKHGNKGIGEEWDVCTEAERARLRVQLSVSLTVVAKVPTMAAARTSDVAADAILMASTGDRMPDDRGDSEERDVGDARGEPLTAREVEVLELLAEG